jgi:hypothetical protein
MDSTDGEKTGGKPAPAEKKSRSVTIAYGSYAKYVPIVLVAALIGLLGFAGGVQYEKGHVPIRPVAGLQMPGPGGRFGYRGAHRTRGALGTVTSVSSSSITIQNQRSGTDETFKITSTTTVTNNGTSASVSDIKNGTSVLVRTTGSDANTASQILLNPQLPGGAGMTAPGATQSSPQASPSGTQTN